MAGFSRHVARIEKQPQIGRRNPLSHLPIVFLDVVGDKPVVGFIAEVSEVAPGAQQNVAQKQFVPGTDRYDFFPGGAIKPERQAWTEGPEQENGGSDKERMQVTQG